MPATLRVLYIEDNPADVQLLRDLLDEVPDHGLEVVNRETLKEALGAGAGFDAVILDLNLPDSQGLATYQAVAKTYPGLPVIILTAIDMETLAIDAVRGGAQDYLVKGMLTGHLITRALRYAIERTSLLGAMAKANEFLEERVLDRTEELNAVNEVLFREVEQRKLKEIEIREQRNVLRDILDGLQAAVLFIDVRDHRIVEANRVSEQLLGIPRGQILAEPCHDLLCQGARGFLPADCPKPCAEILHKDFLLKRKDGKVIPVIRTVLATTINGREHRVVILFDVSERKTLERQLAIAQKLEAIGQLAAGIAHEINTPVQYIIGNIEFFETVGLRLARVMDACARLEEAVRGGGEALPEAALLRQTLAETRLPQLLEEFPQALADVKEGLQRITTIIAAMKNFSHPGTDVKKPVDLNAAVRNTTIITRNEWKYTSDLKLELAEDLPRLSCYPGDFNQVLLNLLVNAAQANAAKFNKSSSRGTITISTRRSGKVMLVSIADTGVGIPEKNWSRIFDPFFTTKEVGEGTGQGLAIAHSIVKRHGGNITFTSQEGEGTTFTVAIPIESGPQSADTTASTALPEVAP